MHRVFFDLKRAYHSTLRLTRRLLKRLGLTAARFDLLYIVEKAGKTMLQCDLRRVLGVTAPTVSRMLSSLQALGLVEREVMDMDRRRRHVTLTKAGLRCVRRAARHLIHSGWVELAVDSALCPHRWFNAEESSRARGILSTTLNRLRYAYGDRATRDYPIVLRRGLRRRGGHHAAPLMAHRGGRMTCPSRRDSSRRPTRNGSLRRRRSVPSASRTSQRRPERHARRAPD